MLRPAALLPAGTRLLLLNTYLSTVPLGFLIVVVPLYLARVGFDPAFIGLLFTISSLAASILVAFSGLLADRFGRGRFLVAGTVLPIASYAIFAATTDRAWLVVAATFGGVGLANGAAGALTISSFDALLAERTTSETRPRVFASAQALWSLGLATGALSAGLPDLLRRAGVSDIASYRPSFLLAIALTLVAGALVLPLRDMHVPDRDSPRDWLPRRSLRPIAVYSLGIAFLGFGLGVAVQLMPLWFNLRFGVGEADVGPWYAAGQLLSLATVLLVPWLDRTLGGSRSVLVAQLLSGTLLALIVVAPAFPVAATLFVARSYLTNLAWPFQQSLLMGAVVPEERASAVGFGFAVWGFANALGPTLGGTLLGTGVLALPLALGAVAYVAAGLAFSIGFGRIRTPAGAVTERALPLAPPEPLPKRNAKPRPG